MAVFAVGVLAVAIYSNKVREDIVNGSLLDSAKRQVKALEEFRTIYTAEVVERVRAHPDFEVSHDYKNRPMAIPLPATLSMELGARLGVGEEASKSLLYSPYPFPWREDTGGLRDSFQQEAWERLPQEDPYYRFETYKGVPALRYATADRMRKECVDCHNTHPDTPRNDWKEGDIRGVLEVIQPMGKITALTAKGRAEILMLTASVLVYGAVVLGLLLVQVRRNERQLNTELEDRTESIRDMEHRLRASHNLAALGEITSGMAHELNQPLGTMKLSCDTLLSTIEQDRPKDSARVADRISRQVDRLDGIIQKFSSFAGKGDVSNLECTDLAAILRQAVAETAMLSHRAGVRVELALQPTLPDVYADPIEMEMVARNILTNALHATEGQPQPHVSVETGYDDHVVYFEIEDNGPGIPAEVQDRIFEPFFTTKAVDKGTGLGLSLCYGIMDRHAGSIEIRTTGPEGTCFKVTIPRVESS